jgi:hypothetical protein
MKDSPRDKEFDTCAASVHHFTRVGLQASRAHRHSSPPIFSTSIPSLSGPAPQIAHIMLREGLRPSRDKGSAAHSASMIACPSFTMSEYLFQATPLIILVPRTNARL